MYDKTHNLTRLKQKATDGMEVNDIATLCAQQLCLDVVTQPRNMMLSTRHCTAIVLHACRCRPGNNQRSLCTPHAYAKLTQYDSLCKEAADLLD